MSITFELETGDRPEPLNLNNANAAALMALAGLAAATHGDVGGKRLGVCIGRLLMALNTDSKREPAVALGCATVRWIDGSRTDGYLLGRIGDLLALFVAARRLGCRVVWS